jgi:uncharacterized membrane protein YtjA (UPF0391 family)
MLPDMVVFVVLAMILAALGFSSIALDYWDDAAD